MDLRTPVPRPEGSFRFVNAQIEFVVRCPVPIRRMAEISGRLTRKLASVIEEDPRLKPAAGTAPKIA